MSELKCPEEPVLEHLNKVGTAQRVASVQCRSEGVGQRQEVNRKKQAMKDKAARKNSNSGTGPKKGSGGGGVGKRSQNVSQTS